MLLQKFMPLSKASSTVAPNWPKWLENETSKSRNYKMKSNTTTPKPPYKSEMGRHLSKSLFLETWMKYAPGEQKEVNKPVFSLYSDHDGLINAGKTFVALEDPTGYKWAMKYLGSWEHWQILMRAPWFHEAYEIWVAELEASIKSEAILKLREIANNGSPQSISAAKYLATLEYKKAARGRPSKAELTGELKRQVQLLEDENDDAARIGLKVVS